jgi:cysteine desulfurase
LGVARANRKQGNHIITTAIEHPSVLNACRALERDGFKVTYVRPEKNGTINVKNVTSAITDQTILVTTHLANSEIGVIQDVGKISRVIKAKNPSIFVHVDACQTTPYIKPDVKALGVDLLTFNGSKAYGPKGVAVLYVRSGVSIFPIIYGGGQELSLRSGTENVPGIVGLAKAIEILDYQDGKRIGKLRDLLQSELKKIGCKINVATSPRLPNHLSVILPKTNETDLVSAMNKLGIAVSSGSACSSRSLGDSHVLTSIGLSSEQVNKTIRISLGRSTTRDNCEVIQRGVLSIK